MLDFNNNQAHSEESGANYTVETDPEFGLTSLRVWVEAPEGSGLPDLDLGGQSVFSTEDDARTAAQHIDVVATKAREAMEAAHGLMQVLDQLARQQQQRPQYGVGHQGYALDGNPPEPPRPTGEFGFRK